MKVTIYGASDDLVELEGDMSDEFNPRELDEMSYMSFGDGTVLGIEYGRTGIWRITRLVTGTAKFTKTEGTDSDSDYTDRVTLDGDLRYCVFGSNLVRAKP